MRFTSRIFLGALLAVGLASVAHAETPNTEPGEFTLNAELQLDQQFELSLADAADSGLHRLAGPTTMNCSHSELETCVVTTEGTPRAALPAAIAAHCSEPVGSARFARPSRMVADRELRHAAAPVPAHRQEPGAAFLWALRNR
ncbi:MAG: hypothetical protein AAGC67_07995, partial [Myxococcota bacterium]